MGKNRHSKDRLFLTATEWKGIGGKQKENSGISSQSLPFDHCALSLTRYETPCCIPEGVLFDLLHLIPYVRKYKSNPVTGKPMNSNDIIRLHMAKNNDDKWHCPVTFKIFNNNSRIVAIKTTGNVYAYEAVHELNIKAKNFTDLLSGETFVKSDIITLYDPTNPTSMALRDISTFEHTKQIREDVREEKAKESSVRHNPTTSYIMKQVEIRQETMPSKTLQDIIDSHKPIEYIDDVKIFLDLKPNTLDVNPGSEFTTQKSGASLTSTVAEVSTTNKTRLASPEDIRDAKWKVLRKLGKKGYVQLQTNYGNMNLEIHCDIAHRASWNFIELCTRGYYDNTKFHRLITNFMIQGGDPSGNGSGGMSAWGKPFQDEFDSRLLHDQRGIISMANSGSHTNSSQFFITFAPGKHLNNVHTVFGRIVGGMSVLNTIEVIGSGKNDLPKEEIKIIKTIVFDSPYPEADTILLEEIQSRMKNRKKDEEIIQAKPSVQVALLKNQQELSSSRQQHELTHKKSDKSTSSCGGGVGKYLSTASSSSSNAQMKTGNYADECQNLDEQPEKKKLKQSGGGGGFSNFSGW